MMNGVLANNDNQRTSTNRIMYPKRYFQKYRQQWEDLFFWIARVAGNERRFYCKLCRNEYVAGMIEIRRHQETEKHKLNHARFVENSMRNVSNEVVATSIKREIIIDPYEPEPDYSFGSTEDASDWMEEIEPDQISLQETIPELPNQIESTRLSVTTFEAQRDVTVLEQLRKAEFSLFIDQFTNLDFTNNLILVVRFRDNNTSIDKFLARLSVPSTSSAAIFGVIVDFFTEHRIPYENNMIGFACDAPSFVGSPYDSIEQLFRNKIPRIFVMPCICYSFALCASHACQKIPQSVETLVQNIVNYFTINSTELGHFQVFKDIFKADHHLPQSKGRFRSISANYIVNHILEQWDALSAYFREAVMNISGPSISGDINRMLSNSFNKLYLLFLQFSLPLFTDLNREMQSEHSKVHELYEKVESVCRCLMSMFVEQRHIDECESLQQVQYKDPHVLLPLENIYIGSLITDYFDENPLIPASRVEEFRMSCLDFYTEALDQILMRFSFDRKDLREMRVLAPSRIFKNQSPSIVPLAKEFSHVIRTNELNSLDIEWRLLLAVIASNRIYYQQYTDSDFWNSIKDMKNANNEAKFPLIWRLVNFIDTLPHSNVVVEQIFSGINLHKSAQRYVTR